MPGYHYARKVSVRSFIMRQSLNQKCLDKLKQRRKKVAHLTNTEDQKNMEKEDDL